MQRRNLGKAMRYLVVVGTLVSAFALVACGGDDSQNVDVTVPLNASTVAAVQGVGINIQGGQIFTGVSTGTAVTLVFTIVDANAFTLTGPGGLTSIGRVDYDSSGACTFTVTGPVGGLVQVASVTPFSNCALAIQANEVPEDGTLVLGTLNLKLTTTGGATANSNPLAQNVFIADDGELFVVNPVTGVQVGMGVEP